MVHKSGMYNALGVRGSDISNTYSTTATISSSMKYMYNIPVDGSSVTVGSSNASHPIISEGHLNFPMMVKSPE